MTLNFVDIAVGPVTRANCGVNVGDMVYMSRLQCPILPADYVYLVPRSVVAWELLYVLV